MQMKQAIAGLALAAALGLAGCSNEAQVASYNISQAADNFGVNRHITFVNTWTDKYLFVIEGLCSLDVGDKRIAITCKTGTGPNDYKKHYLGAGNNVTWFEEQVDPSKVSPYHYKVTFNPATIVPSIDMR